MLFTAHQQLNRAHPTRHYTRHTPTHLIRVLIVNSSHSLSHSYLCELIMVRKPNLILPSSACALVQVIAARLAAAAAASIRLLLLVVAAATC